MDVYFYFFLEFIFVSWKTSGLGEEIILSRELFFHCHQLIAQVPLLAQVKHSREVINFLIPLHLLQLIS